MIAAVKVAAAIARLDKGLVRLTSSFKLLPLARHAAPFSPVAVFRKKRNDTVLFLYMDRRGRYVKGGS
jgi:hypothetical protein